MADGRRPGGLTALAVLNFVFAGIHVIQVLGLVVVVAMADKLKAAAHKPGDRAVFEALDHMSMGLWALLMVSAGIALALLIISGVGYLKMRRWGRRLGTAYALLSLTTTILEVIVIPGDLGGGFNIGTIIGIVYPLLTLFFVNVTFKDDLAY